MVEINSLVPDFSLMGSDDKEHKLSQYRGKKVILYFYPRDNTPGCSTEACDFRDNSNSFADKNDIKYYAVLSYGASQNYINKIVSAGRKLWGGRFIPLLQFMNRYDFYFHTQPLLLLFCIFYFFPFFSS